MVQLFYYESRGKNCRKLFRYDGYPCKVFLFPYEGWAVPAMQSYWTLKSSWWNRKRCKIVEICGTTKRSTKAKMVTTGKGTMCITGKFKGGSEPDFKMHLSTDVSNADFQMGYSMTGTLERGKIREGRMEMTHYAMIKRKGY